MNQDKFKKEYEELSKTRFGGRGIVLTDSSLEGDKWLFLKLSQFFEDISTIAKNSELANKKDTLK